MKYYHFLFFSDPMTHLDIQELANLTAGDADVENFERLFTKLKEMKGDCLLNKQCLHNQEVSAYHDKMSMFSLADKASSLPHDQRKVHAEKVSKSLN